MPACAAAAAAQGRGHASRTCLCANQGSQQPNPALLPAALSPAAAALFDVELHSAKHQRVLRQPSRPSASAWATGRYTRPSAASRNASSRGAPRGAGGRRRTRRSRSRRGWRTSGGSRGRGCGCCLRAGSRRWSSWRPQRWSGEWWGADSYWVIVLIELTAGSGSRYGSG